MLRNSGIASGESIGRKSGGWDETNVGAVGADAPVGVQKRYALHIDLICPTAGHVTRTSGGVGGGAVRLLPIPISLQSVFHKLEDAKIRRNR